MLTLLIVGALITGGIMLFSPKKKDEEEKSE